MLDAGKPVPEGTIISADRPLTYPETPVIKTYDSEGHFTHTKILLGYNNTPIDRSVSAAAPPGYFSSSGSAKLRRCGDVREGVNIRLPPRLRFFGPVKGHVYDSETGDPIALADVSAFPPLDINFGECAEPPATCLTTTEDEPDRGFYSLPKIPVRFADRPSRWSVNAAMTGYYGDSAAVDIWPGDAPEQQDLRRIRRGEIDVVVGTRSAIFAPLHNVGLIVVDEEHDASYKQEESPRYNARDVAIVRGQRANALVVLGSATPSMETYHNAVTGKYERVVLEQRVLGRPLAAVTVVDMREEFAAGGPDVVLSRALTRALEARLERREQALVLLNRRGFATSVFCRQCAGTIDCPNCSVSLVVHGEGRSQRAQCHYCNYSARVPGACPICAAPYLEQAGFGTERVEAEMKSRYPAARIARMDRDAIRRKGALGSLLSRFREGEIDILVGTQMIAKGHDFPRVTLVGVISADVGLGMADFRASERTFQLLTQVAGRAGRGEQPGEAIIQTLYPGPLQRSARLPAGLSGLLRARAQVSPGDALSSGRVGDQRDRPRADLRGRDGRRSGHCRADAEGRGTRRVPCARTGAGAARQASRGVPRAAAREEPEPQEDA